MASYSWNIFGHEKTREYLEAQLKDRGLGHGLLFVGQEHIGKFTVAKTLANILQCEKELCRRCPACIQIKKGCHLDTIDIADDGEPLKIEQIREIINRMNMTSQSNSRVVLLENIGRLTEEAANALLKILEEPGEKTYFFFTAQTLREVLPTIRSRMHILKLTAPVTDETFFQFLKNQYRDLTEQAYEKLLLLALGKPGKIIALLESPEVMTQSEYLYDTAQRFCTAFSLSARFKLIQEFKDDDGKIAEFLTLMTALLRQKFLHGSVESERNMAVKTLPAVIEALGLLRKNVNTRLLLENLALQF